MNACAQGKTIVFLCIVDFAMRAAHRFVPRIAAEGFDHVTSNSCLKAANVNLVFSRSNVSYPIVFLSEMTYINIVFTIKIENKDNQ